MPKYTEHARQRRDQRAFNDLMITILQMEGDELHDHNGDVYIAINSKRKRRQLVRDLKRAAEKIGALNQPFMVQAHDGSIVTLGHAYRRHYRL